MTQSKTYKPYLIVNRLIILRAGKSVYDERFHTGVNIIRGKNSSGKSTIVDFIFYALGGDLNKWKNEAKSCDFTLIEVSLSGKIFTLKREISESTQRGMEIFEGTVEAATKNVSDWLKYPYRATENKESFYQAILKELGIPYSKSDDNNSITMHQLLRLMYVDQMTSLDRVFKFDRFDSPNKRKAIGELMIGLSDFDLYVLRVNEQKLSAKLDSKIKEIKYLHEFFGEEIKTIDSIELEIAAQRQEIETLEAQLASNNDETSSFGSEEIDDLRETVQNIRKELNIELENVATKSYELADSKKFIHSLNEKLIALDESSMMINELADIGFTYCPACFSALKAHAKDQCELCGSSEQNDSDNPTFRIRKEIEFQLKESSNLIESKQVDLAESETRLNILQTKLDTKTRQLSFLLKPSREVSAHSRRLLVEIGAANRKIDELNESKTRFGKLKTLYLEREALQKELNITNDEIQKKEQRLESERTSKKKRLSELTKEILRADPDHEEIFLEGKSVDIDFAEDRVSIDDRALFSASSMVYLKNAFRLSLLEASCLDSSYIYPRFLLLDNVEDKGMEMSRSQLFQREIVRVSKQIEVSHQIIFTTSMIAPELDTNEFCVGDKYDDKNKSLKLK